MKFEIAPKTTETRLNWADARLYCFALNIGGKSGWRLPSKEELNEIYESDNDFAKNFYWSSTEFNAYNAWLQLFANGYQNGNDKDSNYYVRAIRSVL